MKRLSSVLLATAVFGAGVAVHAATTLSAVGDSSLKFEANGPAGLKINGESGGIGATEASGKITLTAPTTQFHTGIGLRDRHLREAIEAEKHPRASLVVDRASIKLPEGGPSSTGKASGSLTLHGVTQAAPFTYTITRKADGYHVHGELEVNIRDYHIEKPCYLGVCVGEVVKIAADLNVQGA